MRGGAFAGGADFPHPAKVATTTAAANARAAAVFTCFIGGAPWFARIRR
jgi:hypothetical protein